VTLRPFLGREEARTRAGATGEAVRVLSRCFLRRVGPEAADQPFLFELIESQASSAARHGMVTMVA
jgi:hypothetical protein